MPVTHYLFDIATDSLFVHHAVDSTSADTWKVVTGLENGRTYCWRVKAQSVGGWGAFSEKRKFFVFLTGVEPELSRYARLPQGRPTGGQGPPPEVGGAGVTTRLE